MGTLNIGIIGAQARRLIAVLSCIALTLPVLFSQKKWTGTVNERWDNPLNWQPVGVPGASDNVILDNSFLRKDYKVYLPDQVIAIHSLSIHPETANRIELTLPASNVTSPALQVYESGNSITIRKGGVLRNSSGLNSGQSLSMNGLLCVYNEGTYVHNSRSAHAADIVAKLSAAPGTEKGIFEYNVPGGSYPISLSNRSYGTLSLSSSASGGTQTYNASGTNEVVIAGHFILDHGVQFNVDLTKDLIINGSYIQTGGVFNIASQNNNNVVIIRGDVSQESSGLITETAAGLPVLELSSSSPQRVSAAGRFDNSVTLRINNPDGIVLLNHLSLSFKLHLVKGKVKSSPSAFITLQDNGTITGASSDSFIEGPLKKVGDDDFEFPIGKENDYAPVKISGTGGSINDEVTATYYLSNPATVYGPSFENPPVVRVSSLEYWTVERSGGTQPRRISLSVGTYSQATALEHLVVLRWDTQASNWRNAGNSFYSGITTGSITSNELSDFGPFTLGSTIATQNPLPLPQLNFIADFKGGTIDLRWDQGKNKLNRHYEVEKSLDGKLYQHVMRIPGNHDTRHYQFRYAHIESNDIFFRLKITSENGYISYSEPVKVSFGKEDFKIIKIFPVVVKSELTLQLRNGVSGKLDLLINDCTGRVLRQFNRYCKEGENTIKIDLQELGNGTYILQIKDTNQMARGYLFFKQ